MDWELNYLEDNILVVNCEGEFSNDDLETMVQHIISDRKWQPDNNLIIDFTDLIIEKIGIDDIYSSLDIHRQFNDLISGKIAVVNKDLSGHGLSSLYEEISRKYVKSKYASFINFNEAVEWIRGN